MADAKAPQHDVDDDDNGCGDDDDNDADDNTIFQTQVSTLNLQVGEGGDMTPNQDVEVWHFKGNKERTFPVYRRLSIPLFSAHVHVP